jgi:hypothetical protein
MTTQQIEGYFTLIQKQAIAKGLTPDEAHQFAKSMVKSGELENLIITAAKITNNIV